MSIRDLACLDQEIYISKIHNANRTIPIAKSNLAADAEHIQIKDAKREGERGVSSKNR